VASRATNLTSLGRIKSEHAHRVTISQLLNVISVALLVAAAVLARRRLRSEWQLSVVLMASLALCLMPVLMRQPLHKGQPVGYWVDSACKGHDSSESLEFRKEVKDIGPAAVPHLVQRLRPLDGWRNAYRDLRTYLPSQLQQLLPDVLSVQAIAEQRYGAIHTLAMFGPDAKPAVATLARLLPRLKPPVRDTVFAVLIAIGPDAKKALPVLHSLLTNQDDMLRVDIAEALWHIGWETNKLLEICTNALASTNMWAAQKAGYILRPLLTAAGPAVPFALKVLNDTNHPAGARMNAAEVLGAARVSTPEVRTALLDGVQPGQDLHLRSSCARALWRLDSQYAPLATRLALEDLIFWRKELTNANQGYAFSTWLEARSLDPPQESIPTLQQLLKSDSSDMRKEAAAALLRIQIKTKAGAGHIEGVR
jgi:HEAT repeat protein